MCLRLRCWYIIAQLIKNSLLEGWHREAMTGWILSLFLGVNMISQEKISKKKENTLFNFWDLPRNQNLLDKAKQLRKAGILSEVLFWSQVKGKVIQNYDFDRQVVIGNYIVDFFIDELGLIFEIDGSSHNNKQEYDNERDRYFESLDIKVIHISDIDVKKNIEGVMRYVLGNIIEREKELRGRIHPVSPADCHPSRGEL